MTNSHGIHEALPSAPETLSAHAPGFAPCPTWSPAGGDARAARRTRGARVAQSRQVRTRRPGPRPGGAAEGARRRGEPGRQPRGGRQRPARWAAPGAVDARAPVLVLGHFDTVWPRGTLAVQPFRLEEGRAYGPGSFDMKAGLVLLEFAVAAIRAQGRALRRPIVVLWTTDEEIGSPGSRRSRPRPAALPSYSCSSPRSRAATSRRHKGVGRFTLVVEGRPAHAGLEPEKGISAVVAGPPDPAAPRLNDPSAGTTVNVGIIAGGTMVNVVPAGATATIDVRVATRDEAERIERAPAGIGSRAAGRPGACRRGLQSAADGTLTPEPGALRRAPRRRPGARPRPRRGIDRRRQRGNSTAALGVPTLDGLGAIRGGGPRRGRARIVVALPERAACWRRPCWVGKCHERRNRDPARRVDRRLPCLPGRTRAHWGISEEEYVVPIATMVGAQLHGGLVLGAFLSDGRAVGVSFAFLGRIDGRLGLYSQLTGVVPGQQGHGLGGRLKQAQRQFARDAGLEEIAWAFDPLQAGNAQFNLGRLGARSHTYVENMYGTRTDALNAGVPTDRLIVLWSTVDKPPPDVAGPTDLERFPRVVEALPGPDGALDLILPDATSAMANPAPGILLEIPMAIARLRSEAPGLAERGAEPPRRPSPRSSPLDTRRSISCGSHPPAVRAASMCSGLRQRSRGEIGHGAWMHLSHFISGNLAGGGRSAAMGYHGRRAAS